MTYKLKDLTLKSRRGDYNLVELESNPIIWTLVPLDPSKPRHRDVIQEVDDAVANRLHLHKYWQDETAEFIAQYQYFYKELFSLRWLHKNEDRHNIAVNPFCCLTLVQYHNHQLIAYSRSTDMRNGYFSDKLLLDYLAQQINTWRPDCKVDIIIWYLAIPHAYTDLGIARLKENYK